VFRKNCVGGSVVIQKTYSLCPVCLKKIKAEIQEGSEKVIIKKECPEHGTFKDVYWSDKSVYERFSNYDYKGGGLLNPHTETEKGCPLDCGICPQHESHTILGLIDVTNRCNLNCPICFANAAVSKYLYEPSYEEIKEMLRNLRDNRPVPTPAIQYAGGEPTVRKDIVELVKLARDEGFTHIQIATNGVKLAMKPELARELREAGLNTVYLQFDGVTEEPYLESRGKNLLPIKLKAIENCRKAKLGIVLVPTLVKGINDQQVGDIIRFAIKNIDIIRGVNFQPISFTGRTPANKVEEQRITIPDFQRLVEEQTDGQIKIDDFYPASSVCPISDFVAALEGEPQVTFTCHPHCGTATYIFVENSHIIPITRFIDVDRFFKILKKDTQYLKEGGITGKAKAITRSAIELPKTLDSSKAPKSIDIKNILISVFKERSYRALGEFHKRTLLISCMHFMDPWNFDINRVRRCVIHYATPDGRIIPFCTMNSIYRESVERKFAKPFKEKSA